MSRKGEGEGRAPGMMLAIFILILVSYLVYIMLLHPWERKELLTVKSNITINVVDCDSGYPINDARIIIYDETGNKAAELITVNGRASYSDFPDCFRVKATFGSDLYEGICIGSGEEKVVNFCYEYPEANPDTIFYTEDVGVVGGTSGEVINFKEFENLVFSFPLNNATVNYPGYFLYSNIFWSEGMGIELTKINKELTKRVNFEFKLESKRGDPYVKVISGNQVLFNEKVNADELVKVTINQQSLNETIDLQVKCDFDGWMFWTTQDCNLTDIKATQEFYIPALTKREFNFSASSIELQAGEVELRFINNKESIGGVKASINGVELFDSNSLLAKNYSASIPVQMLDLQPEGNLISFNANPGADLFLRGVRLYFTSPVTNTQEKEVSFEVADSDFRAMDKAIISFFVKNVYLNGTLKFKMNNVFYNELIDKAGWNHITIDKEDLLEDNVLLITAPQGRFEIDELKITYE